MATLSSIGCRTRKPSAPSYHGTVIIGGDYVQVLATIDGHNECKPRIQSANQCVRSPPNPNAPCAKIAPCIEEIEVRTEVHSAAARGSFVKAPWLDEALQSTLVIVIRGCAGERELTVTLGAAPAAFSDSNIEMRTAVGGTGDATKTSARRTQLDWAAPGRADLACALRRTSEFSEVCCAADVGELKLETIPGVRDVRLSRGKLLGQSGRLEIYRTKETSNLLGDPQ